MIVNLLVHLDLQRLLPDFDQTFLVSLVLKQGNEYRNKKKNLWFFVQICYM